jgi:tRNA G18 (ribose-2'-O)-methylase SpoU
MFMRMILVLENVRSVYNVGSIFRTMEGFGFNEIALIGITPTPLDKKGNKRKDFIKTALGAEDRIKWSFFETNEKLIEEYKEASVWCLERDDTSKPLWESLNAKEDGTVLLVIGSEVDGVSSYWLEKASKILHIPMKGEKESFNVTIATGIALYEITKKNTA